MIFESLQTGLWLSHRKDAIGVDPWSVCQLSQNCTSKNILKSNCAWISKLQNSNYYDLIPEHWESCEIFFP